MTANISRETAEEVALILGAFEEVSIERVHVGDYIWIPSPGSSRQAHTYCVVSKAMIRREPTDRFAGWRVVLANAGAIWLPRSAQVHRRRFQVA